MDFLILGPMEVFDGTTRRLLSGSTLRTLLAVFLLNANVVVSVDRLIDLLWDQEAPGTARHALHVHISRLRHALFDPNRTDVGLERQDPGYILHVATGRIDANRFERSVHLGHDIAGLDPRRATAAFDEALRLWRGPLLMDLGEVGFAIAARERLDEMRLDAVEERFACQLAMGRDADLVGDLRAHIAGHPLRERPVGQLMIALYRSGRQSEALSAFAAARVQLADEIGVEPGPRLIQLRDAILQHDPAL